MILYQPECLLYLLGKDSWSDMIRDFPSITIILNYLSNQIETKLHINDYAHYHFETFVTQDKLTF